MALDMNVDFDDRLEQLARIPKAVRLGVVAAILIAVSGAYWYLSYQPAQAKRAELVARSQELQRTLNNARSVACPLSKRKCRGSNVIWISL